MDLDKRALDRWLTREDQPRDDEWEEVEVPEQMQEARFQEAQAARDRADKLRQQVLTEVRALRPIGVPSEISLAMGARPKKGVLVGTPVGTFVFAKDRLPAETQIADWEEAYRVAKELDENAMFLGMRVGLDVDTVTGNREVWLAEMQRLQEAGWLTSQEEDFVAQVERFFARNPEAKYGVMTESGEIVTEEQYDEERGR